MNDRPMMDLNRLLAFKDYPKNATLWVAMTGILVLGAGLVYFPIHRSYHRISRNLTMKKQEVQKAKASGIHQLSPSEFARLQKEVSGFKLGFMKVSQVGTVLNNISEEAEKNNIKVVSIDSEAPQPLMMEAGKESPEEIAHFSRLPIKIRLEAHYKGLGNSLALLADRWANHYVVESFRVEKKSVKSAVLDCEITLSFFVNNT